jgi:glyoxylase-like metal-dependent hydrolase (beta-lactamase superfamily II)
VTLEKILVTHGHIDHAGGVAELGPPVGLPIEGPQRDDQFWIDGMPAQSKMFGFANVRAFTPTAGWNRATRHGPMSTFGAERRSNPFCGD